MSKTKKSEATDSNVKNKLKLNKMKKYIKLLENGIESKIMFGPDDNMYGDEMEVIYGLFKNGLHDNGDDGALSNKLSVKQLIKASSSYYFDKLTTEQIAVALQGMEERGYIKIDFESGLITSQVKFQK